jgi:hypothetical protein
VQRKVKDREDAYVDIASVVVVGMGQAEFLGDRGDAFLDGLCAVADLLCDRSVGTSLGHEGKDLPLDLAKLEHLGILLQLQGKPPGRGPRTGVGGQSTPATRIC